MQRTLSIIKPDAVQQGNIGNILSIFESSGLGIVAAKLMRLTRAQAEQLYRQHADRSFYSDLLDYICGGPIVALVLEGEKAIDLNRRIMGATNPADAEPGTIRNLYAKSIDANAVHGSDSEEAAEREIDIFFQPEEFVR